MDTAAKILGGSNVATSTAAQLLRNGIDARRVAELLSGRDAQIGRFRFKFIDADRETPENFGVLVRRL
jgi:hypothetical protein